MLEKNGVSSEVRAENLKIIEGNVRGAAAVKQTLSITAGKVADIIVLGVGAAPKFSANPLKLVTIDQPDICATAAETVVKSVSEIQQQSTTGSSSSKPVMVAVSTTGIDDRINDVPFGYSGLYHWLLAVPHVDKRKMEKEVLAAKEKGIIGNFVILRPTLLFDKDSNYGAVRAGYFGRKSSGKDDRWNSKDGPALGYTIGRKDVGEFAFREIVEKNARGEWAGQHVTLTY